MVATTQATAWRAVVFVSCTAVVTSTVGASADRRSRPEKSPKTTGILSRLPPSRTASEPPSIAHRPSASCASKRAFPSAHRGRAQPCQDLPADAHGEESPVRVTARPSAVGVRAVATTVVGDSASAEAGGLSTGSGARLTPAPAGQAAATCTRAAPASARASPAVATNRSCEPRPRGPAPRRRRPRERPPQAREPLEYGGRPSRRRVSKLQISLHHRERVRFPATSCRGDADSARP